MSLISDTDFLIHSLRLSYLREVEDPYAARILTLNPSYQSNLYIHAASLADVDRWPELAMPSSPNLSEDDGERSSGFPGARLKSSQTIMGGKSGALGLRVSGKKTSTSKRMSGTPRQADVAKYVPGDKHLPDTLPIVGDREPSGQQDANNSASSSPQPNVQVQEPTAVDEPPMTKVIQFVPPFNGAEMEKRRRERIARRGRVNAAPPSAPPRPIPDSSSEDEVTPPTLEESSSDEFEMIGTDSNMDDGDEFDPDFAANRTTVTSDGASEVLSVFSNGSNSISNSSVPLSTSNSNVRTRHRRSPEGVRKERRTGSYLERSTPSKHEDDNPTGRKADALPQLKPPTSPYNSSSASLHPIPSPDINFTRKAVGPLKVQKSSLSAMLASSSSSSNPFSEFYAAISGRGEAAASNVKVYFPHAKKPAGRTMDLNVRKDSTVEEVIGFALWTYWEDGWLPKLDEGLFGEDDPKWAIKVSAVGWILRIAEDDGEVDDDFPPPDRSGKVVKFNADAFAVLEATAGQVQQNQVLESKIVRRPSRTTSSKKHEKLTVPSTHTLPTIPSGSAIFGSALGSLSLSTSLGPSSSHGPQIFLRIRVEDTADAVHISTTIPVSAGMYMQEALELVCRKRKLMNPNDYVLVVSEGKILIPLDRTVASLQGKRELLLLKRSALPMNYDITKLTGKTTDPNASIFKRMSDTPEVVSSSTLLSDFSTAYKKYTIYRKTPIGLARQERTLAIDGGYVHIMPTANKAKAVFDSAKTSSYHIKSIADCQQSAKTSPVFKLVFLTRKGGTKRYDFEAETPKLAAEIVHNVKTMRATVERSETLKSRKSRHVE
ncbi:hypothetical protein BDN72DRAFT_844502 [Pluteus cervinus]|uniref:Uncharacterized protein n=1 Tax=Pluteus cervinus TaxID=181527 RepID=A0ACD3AKX9_9AGAR|nr:hypothetical protein BDN72DRAFT_844502 [Pluteus cervinus]